MPQYIVGVGFSSPRLNYYESDLEVAVGNDVVVETALGFEIGKVQVVRPFSEKDEGLFPSILRIANFQDMGIHTRNLERAKEVVTFVQRSSDDLHLNMCVIQAFFSLDNSKVLVTYTADERVDFRELLKILSAQYHCRIELRQIGPRDKASLVGGLGVCGLELCCSTFLDTFDGISISMAKNQMLSLNIPKLSGQCGKLMCCLKYEDEAYSELRTQFPPIGSKVSVGGKEYYITGLNVLSGNLTISDHETISTVNIKDVKVLTYGRDKDVKKKQA